MTAPNPKLSSSGWAITTSTVGQAGNVAAVRPARESAGFETFMTVPKAMRSAPDQGPWSREWMIIYP